MIFCLIFSFILIGNTFASKTLTRQFINTTTDLVLDGRVRANNVHHYYKFDQASSMLNCTAQCLNDNKCLMSTYLKPFELCYLYAGTQFKATLVADYGASFIKKNVMQQTQRGELFFLI